MVKITSFLRYLIIIVIILLFMLPALLALLNSFKSEAELQKLTPSLFFTPVLDNYISIFQRFNFLPYLKNSIYISITTILITSLIGIPAAYALSRATIFFKKGLMFLVLLVRLLPYIIFILPLFIFFTQFNIKGTFFSLFITMMMISLPLTIWLMKGFFDDIPVDFEEAAYIDGASRFRAFVIIVLPHSAPGIAAITVLGYIFTWNQFLIPLIMGSTNMGTLSYGVIRFLGGEVWGEKIGAMSAWVFATIIPVILITIAINKYLVKGFIQGID